MNDALKTALAEKGIHTEADRVRFAESVGMSERTLRRWLTGNVARPNRGLLKVVARRLGVKPEEISP